MAAVLDHNEAAIGQGFSHLGMKGQRGDRILAPKHDQDRNPYRRQVAPPINPGHHGLLLAGERLLPHPPGHL